MPNTTESKQVPAKSRGMRPDYCFDFVREITAEWLSGHGVKGLLLDIDNTITRWEKVEVPEPEMAWLRTMESSGFSCRLLSNGIGRKKVAVEAQTGIKMVSARIPKPVRAAFLSGLDDLKLGPSEVMMIGDSVFTDIISANHVGIWTCLVEPLSPVDFIGSKIYRLGEKLLNLRRPMIRENDFRKRRRA